MSAMPAASCGALRQLEEEEEEAMGWEATLSLGLYRHYLQWVAAGRLHINTWSGEEEMLGGTRAHVR
jgi:hypothetical protein